jgi:hypothetical protein
MRPASSSTRAVAALAAETTADAAAVAGQAASLPAVAAAFVHSLANSDFQGAETAFDEQMKAAVTPEKLQTLWQGLIQQVGTYQSVNGSRTVVVHGYTTDPG